MFVNDTGRLPDSGRVCVMGFQAQQGGSKTYYSLLIDAARAEVEPMAEPRNPAHVLGVGAQIESVNGPVFAAYFAASRERFDAQPNYKRRAVRPRGRRGLFRESRKHRHHHSPRIHARANSRCCVATVRSAASSIAGRGIANRSVSVNGGVRSGDFMREMVAMVREYS